MNITETWAKSTTRRMQKGGDLYRRPLTRAEMTAPLSWAEKQLAVCRRYGEMADGTIGYEVRATENLGHDPYDSVRVRTLPQFTEAQRREADGILACFETNLTMVRA